MSKTKKSLMNAVTALINMMLNSITALILSQTILTYYGSDYNGINATINQVVGAIMILEGGFTIASNVALFKPFSQSDYTLINGILSATKKRFQVVGVIALLIGIVITAVYPLFIDTAMPYPTLVSLMLIVLVPACFNLGVTMKYRVLVLTDQKEYVLSAISTVAIFIGNTAAILLIRSGFGIILARFSIGISLLVSYIIISIYCKKRYPNAKFNKEPMFNQIKGTKSVIVLKITSLFYSSAPIIAISLIPANGALLASVYSVYRNITSLIGNSLNSLSCAPRLSFGALFSEGRTEETKVLFNKYEMIICMCLSVLLGTTCILFRPFVTIYTAGVTDINYQNNLLIGIMLLTIFFQTIHIPSGQMIQMSGHFSASKRIQMIACIVLLPTLVIGAIFYGIYGITASTLIASVLLAVCEISYVRKKLIIRKLSLPLKNYTPVAVICIACAVFAYQYTLNIDSYLSFAFAGVISVAILSVLTFITYFLINHRDMVSLIKSMFSILRKGLTKIRER